MQKQTALLRITLALWVTTMVAPADVLITTKGERFIGRVIEERTDAVVFDSESAGRLTLPRDRIQELQQEAPAPTPPPSAAATPAVTNADWHPPGVGTDGYDWIQLDTDEWLKGWLRYAQKRDIKFESDKMEELMLEWGDIKRLYTGEPMFVKFDGRAEVYGNVVVSNQMVFVDSAEPVGLSRYRLTGITPGGERELSFWSGELSLGLNLQSGNRDQLTLNVQGELARRTPATEFVLDFLSNYSELNGVESANNARLNGTLDVLLSRNFFVRPAMTELYHDRLLNIKYRTTAAAGVGYYLFNGDDLRWLVAGGPGYQYTRFETVEEGAADDSSTPALVFETSFKGDVTRRITFRQQFRAIATEEEAGLYTHHSVSALEFEIKHHLDLNVSLVWDFLLKPRRESSGDLPSQTDLYLIVGLGLKF